MPKTWTDEECNFLKEGYLEMTNEELADKFDVTATSIRKKLERLGLKRSATSTASQKTKAAGTVAAPAEPKKAKAKKVVAKKEKEAEVPAPKKAVPIPVKVEMDKTPELKDGFKEYDMKNVYKVGDFVFHKVWNDAGEVMVTGTTEDGHKFIQVDFQKYGSRRLVIDYVVA